MSRTVSTRFIITTDGKAFREDSQLTEINLSDQIGGYLASGRVVKLPRFATARWGQVGVSFQDDKNLYWTFEMLRLPIKAPYRPISNGIITPNFGSTSDPVLALDWTPPPSMRLRVLMWTTASRDYHFVVHRGFMFAIDTDEEKVWRLPMGNLYDDCRVCLGNDALTGHTHMDAAMAGMNQMQNGIWNADLWNCAEQTAQMFRFRLTEAGHSQEGPNSSWAELCNSVGNGMTEKLTH